MNKDIIVTRLDVLEVLGGKKTTLICKKCDIPMSGNIRITDLHGNIHIEKYFLSMPKQCFSSKDIMFINVDDSSVSLNSKIEYISDNSLYNDIIEV
ncbi:MAG: hypothetical protein MJZ11_03780 [Lachnospiraceae bacterium]|nr:hypothetical protein [Lachnospiraceae bacterium]